MKKKKTIIEFFFYLVHSMLNAHREILSFIYFYNKTNKMFMTFSIFPFAMVSIANRLKPQAQFKAISSIKMKEKYENEGEMNEFSRI